MATDYPGSSSQRDVIPALCPLNSYAESAIPGNMMYINYSTTSAYSDSLMEHYQSPQNCAELPVASSILSQDSSGEVSRSTASYPGIISNSVASRLGVNVSMVWRGSRNEMFVQPRVTGMQGIGEQINSANVLVGNTRSVNPEIGLGTHLGILQDGQNLQLPQSDVTTVQGKGLSLSLGSQMPSAVPVSSFQFQQENPDASCKDNKFTGKSGDTCPSAFGEIVHITKGDFSRNFPSPVMKQMRMNLSPYGLTNFANAITNPRYLKAAQQLLDEVVNVQSALRPETNKTQQMSSCTSSSKERDMDTDACGNPLPTGAVQESAPSATIELSAAERQELQMKLTQLLSMLDEVMHLKLHWSSF